MTQMLTDEPRPRLPPLLRVGLLLLIILKFVLISHEEILPYGNDDSGFAQMAHSYYWKAKFSEYTYVKPAVYPLFVSGAMVTGVPLRLAAEALWALACVALARAVWRCGAGQAAALAASGLSLYHPWSILVLNRVLMDALYAPLFVIFVAALATGLAATSRRELRHVGTVCAVAGALAANTREESVLTYAILLAGGVIALALWWLKCCDKALAMRRLALMTAAPLAATVVLTQALCAANYARIGAWVTYDLNLPGYRSLYNALLSIPPEQPRLDLPIPRDVREKAYAASPAFARLRNLLDGEEARPEFRNACKAATRAENEYGAWTIWALRDAAWRMTGGSWKSAKYLDEFYAEAARELREARERGTLPGRWVPVSWVAPEWGLMIRAAPGVIGHCWTMLMNPVYVRDRTQEVSGWALDNFDAVANRRTSAAKIARGEPAPGAAWDNPRAVEDFDNVKRWLGKTIGWAMCAGFWAGGAGFVASTIFIRRRWLTPGFHAMASALGAAVALRVVLVVLLDLEAVYMQHRYLLPAVPLLLALEFAGVAAGARVASGFFRQWRDSRRARTFAEIGPGQGRVSSSASAPAS